MTILKELFTNLMWFLAGIYLSPLLVVGFIYDLIYTAYKRRLKSFLMNFWTLILESVRVVFWFLSMVGLGIDILGNVICGNIILRICVDGTRPDIHLFRISGVTISAAIGELIVNDKIGKRGKSLARILDAVFFEDYHCEISYYRHLKKLELDIMLEELRDNDLKKDE